jgi:hypothetical protein
MDTANRRLLERRSFWQEHLAQWHASGMTQVAYCRQQGLKLAQFGYWKKRLLTARAPDTAPTAGDFIAVQMTSAGAPLAVVLNARLRVEVYPGFDPVTLRAVIQALSPDVPA